MSRSEKEIDWDALAQELKAQGEPELNTLFIDQEEYEELEAQVNGTLKLDFKIPRPVGRSPCIEPIVQGSHRHGRRRAKR